MNPRFGFRDSGAAVKGTPERCSGLVCGYPRAMLWAGIQRSYRTRVVVVAVDPERCSGLVYGVPTERGWWW